jgi:hypothetical protein
VNLCFARVKPEKDQNHQIEVPQMMKWCEPLHRARRDTWNGVLVHPIGVRTTRLRFPEDCEWASGAVRSKTVAQDTYELRLGWSRMHWNANEEIYQPTKYEPIWAQGEGGRPVGPTCRPPLRRSVSHHHSGPISIVDQGRFDPRATVHPPRLYKQGPGPWGRASLKP